MQTCLIKPRSQYYKQSGLSLIELLISMVIAAFIFSGVLIVMQSSRSAHMTEQETGLLQENQRFAAALLTRDIRLAGSFGCGTAERAHVVNTVDGNVVEDGGLLAGEALIGYEGSAGTGGFPDAFQAKAEPGSDAIILRYADPDSSISIKEHSANSAVLKTHTDHRFTENDILMVVDSSCRHMGIFQLTAGNSMQIKHDPGNGGSALGNCTKVLYAQANLNCNSLPNCSAASCGGYSASPYGNGSEVMQFVSNAYYIGPSTIVPGTLALKRQVLSDFSTRSEEIAQGVESMELLYGVDSDATMDGDINRFVSADQVADWDTVMAVRFNLVLKSQSEVFDSDQSVTINGVTYTDRFVHQLVSSTVQIRNRGL